MAATSDVTPTGPRPARTAPTRAPAAPRPPPGRRVRGPGNRARCRAAAPGEEKPPTSRGEVAPARRRRSAASSSTPSSRRPLGPRAVRVEPGRLDEVGGRSGPGVPLRLPLGERGEVGGERGVGPAAAATRCRSTPTASPRPRRRAAARCSAARRAGPSPSGTAARTSGCGKDTGHRSRVARRHEQVQLHRLVQRGQRVGDPASRAAAASSAPCRAPRPPRRARGVAGPPPAALGHQHPERARRGQATPRPYRSTRPGNSSSSARACSGLPPVTSRRVRAARAAAASTPSSGGQVAQVVLAQPAQPQHRAAVAGDEAAQAVGQQRHGVVAGHHQGQELVGDQPAQREDQRAQRRQVRPVGVVEDEHDAGRRGRARPAPAGPGADGDRVVESGPPRRRRVPRGHLPLRPARDPAGSSGAPAGPAARASWSTTP